MSTLPSSNSPFEYLLSLISSPIVKERLWHLKKLYGFTENDGIFPVIAAILEDGEATRSHVAASADYVRTIVTRLGPAMTLNIMAMYEKASANASEMGKQIVSQVRQEADKAVQESYEAEKREFWRQQRAYIDQTFAQRNAEHKRESKNMFWFGMFATMVVLTFGFVAGVGYLAIK